MKKAGQQPTRAQIQGHNGARRIGQNRRGGGVNAMEGLEWEMRPGGMLVQKRTDQSLNNPSRSSSSSSSSSSPTRSIIRVKVKYGDSYHDIQINPHASVGEFKKMLSGVTGLHPQEQKLIFKDKERDSKSYLDIVGVKDGSKLVLVKDILRQEKRFLELRRSTRAAATTTTTDSTTIKDNKALNSVTQVTIQVDKLAKQVTDLESVILGGGKKVAEKDLLNLIELFMSQLIQLDAIVADGDVKLQRKMQVNRVQKYMEILDKLKAQNASNNRIIHEHGALIAYTSNSSSNHQKHPQKQPMIFQQQQRNFTGLVVGTTKWEKY